MQKDVAWMRSLMNAVTKRWYEEQAGRYCGYRRGRHGRNSGSAMRVWLAKDWREMQKDAVWMRSLNAGMGNKRTQFV
jgi:hypothetical protein